MNEVDTERFRLGMRQSFTSFVVTLAIIICVFFVFDFIDQLLEYDFTFIALGILTYILVHRYIEKRVNAFFEKRLMNSKKRNHTL